MLGIETSCDETSAAVVEGGGDAAAALRALVIFSQDVHRIFGGVVPELASRAHLTAVVPVVERALADAALTMRDVGAVAVTHAPGLVGALLVGVSYAKALAFTLGVPLVAVHHMEGHLFATALEHPEAEPPFTALLVSGGHTLLLDVAAWGEYTLLGATRDDAAGEAFDKVAKLLGLPYPGGRPVEQLAATASGGAPRFPRPMLRANQQPADADYYDVSFSGLKTAVLHAVRAAESRGTLDIERAEIARGFQDALVETLVEKTYRARARVRSPARRPRRWRGVQRGARRGDARAARGTRRARVRAVRSPRHRQRGNDRARRPLPSRSRRRRRARTRCACVAPDSRAARPIRSLRD